MKKTCLAAALAVPYLLTSGIANASAIEEVIITATKRAESSQDVAISVTALSGKLLNDLGFQDTLQITQQVPNFSSQSLFGPSGSPFLNIRGISFIDYTDANESSVGLYVDEIYHGAQGAAAGQLFDVERVEVLRGPQGTLFGRNTTGGLIHYVTKKPGDELEGYGSVQLGSYNQRVFEGAVGGPISENFGVRLSLKSNADDGYQENQVTGTDWAATDVFASRITAVWTPADNLSITGNYHYADSDSTMVGYAFFGTLKPDGSRSTSDPTAYCSIDDMLNSLCVNRDGFRDPSPTPTEIYSQSESLPNTYTAQGGYVNIEWDLGWAALTSISAVEEFERESFQDIDAADNSLQQGGYYHAQIDQFSQEIRLAGNGETMKWVTGFYYFEDDRERESTYLLNDGPYLAGEADLSTESMAIFAQADWMITDTLSLVAGVRYTDEERDMTDLNSYRFGSSIPFFNLPSVDLATEKTTYKAALEYRPNEDVLTYLQYATGFKSGGFNPSLISRAEQVGPVGEETLDSLETGIKSTWLDGRLRANGALFYYDFSDYQAIAGTSIDGVPVSIFFNVGDAEVFGSELELTYVPDDNWEFTLGWGTLNTEFTNTDPNVRIDGRLLEGKELPSAPSYNVNGVITYHHNMGDAGSMHLQSSFMYQDFVWLGPDNNPAEFQEAYGVVNFRAFWEDSASRLRLEAFVNNAFDEEYFMQRFQGAGFDASYGVWGLPRMYGGKVSYNF